MARWERSGYRDLTFMLWHRQIPGLRMIDLDFVQYCVKCHAPLVVAEITERDVLTPDIHKPTTVLNSVAEHLSNNGNKTVGILVAFQKRLPKEAEEQSLQRELEKIQDLECQAKRIMGELAQRIHRLYQRYKGSIFPMVMKWGIKQIYPEQVPEQRLCVYDSQDHSPANFSYYLSSWFQRFRLCEECRKKEEGMTDDRLQPEPNRR